jgi:nicotinamide riboside kinase
MSYRCAIPLLQRRRDDIRQWLSNEAPYAESDQRHLDANTPERAYWHHGYQAALADVVALLTANEKRFGIEGSAS